MPMRVGAELPSLDGAAEWMNQDATPLSADNCPVVIHFWAVSCPACKANMPAVQSLRDEFAPKGVRFIAVHTPRTDSDRNPDEVKRIASEIGITEPCAIDNEKVIGDRFDLSGMWPYYFLFDADGKMKRRGAGGLGLRLLTAALTGNRP